MENQSYDGKDYISPVLLCKLPEMLHSHSITLVYQ